MWQCRVSSPCCSCNSRQVGQSLWALSNSMGKEYEKVNITQITYGWADERNDWNWNTMKCNDGKKCGHWQMVGPRPIIMLSPLLPLPTNTLIITGIIRIASSSKQCPR